jgi:hypothetical protein
MLSSPFHSAAAAVEAEELLPPASSGPWHCSWRLLNGGVAGDGSVVEEAALDFSSLSKSTSSLVLVSSWFFPEPEAIMAGRIA